MLTLNTRILPMSDMYLDRLHLDYLQIPMAVFGPSNHTSRPEGLVIENYKWRAHKIMFGYNKKMDKFIGKSLYRSGCGKPEVHFAPSLPDPCNQQRHWVDLDSNPEFPVHFKHYYTKSWQEWESKMNKWGWKTTLEGFLSETSIYYDLYDDDMARYVPCVKYSIK